MNTTQIPPNTSQTPPRHPPDIPREHEMPNDNNRCQETLPDFLKEHLSVSWGLWRCLLASVGICWHVMFMRCRGVIRGMFGGCLGKAEWYSWKSEAHKCVWGVYGFSSLAVWSENTILVQPRTVRFFVNWPYWDLKLPKWPHVSFPKMIGLCHFLQFLGSPEKNYLWQSLLITLYHHSPESHQSSRLTRSDSVSDSLTTITSWASGDAKNGMFRNQNITLWTWPHSDQWKKRSSHPE